MSERCVKICDFTIKTDEVPGHFIGHCAVFNNVDLGGDKILPGAFTHTLKETQGRWPILMGHRGDSIIGFSTEGFEDTKGLAVKGEFTIDSVEGQNAYAIAKHAARVGAPLGLSIGYRVRKNGAEYDEGTQTRLLKDVDVLEFSIAAVPMNPRARITRVKTVREAEAALRDLGLTGDEARQLISICKGEAGREPFDALEREAKETQQRGAAAFMAAMRGQTVIDEMRQLWQPHQ